MASDAIKGLKARIDAAKEAELAAYIMRDVELRQQNAQEAGVLAYGRKPVPRGRPNERFLQNTLKNIGFANRKLAEDEMWERWDAQKRQQGQASGSGRRRSPEPASSDDRRRGGQQSPERGHRRRRRRESPSEPSGDSGTETGSSSSSDAEASAKAEEAFQGMLATRAVRGRGSTGPRADETGPFLFPTDEQERQEYELLRHTAKPAAGADCPAWIRQQNASPLPRAGGAAEALQEGKAGKVKKKSKKERKERKKAKKAKKERKRRRREAASP